MKEFIVSTDMSCDLTKEYLEENGVLTLGFPVMIDEKYYEGTFEDGVFGKEFYDLMKNGASPKTSLLAPGIVKEHFEKYLSQGISILHLGFSSGMSGAYNSCVLIANELNEKYTDAKVIVVNTLCASLGLGILVRESARLKAEGKSLEEVEEYVEQTKMHMCHVITVGDLKYLLRGGRISRASAIVGTVLNVKPMIHLNNEGKLIKYSTTHGRKKAIMEIANQVANHYDASICKEIDIVQGDCIEDAELLARLVEKKTGVKPTLINMLGSLLGSHCGPDMLACVYCSKDRSVR